MSDPRYIIGVDVGGTFTDVLCLDIATHALKSAKVPSLPGSQWRGVLNALAELGIVYGAIDAFVHGTTIATNTLLEGKGAKTALITTAGFRDTLEIGRTRRLIGGLFDIKFVRPKPLIERSFRVEVPERIAADGEVLVSVEDYDFSGFADRLKRIGIEAVAVGFINSFINDEYEYRASKMLRNELKNVPVCASTAVVREKGEFERFSTCALNAYLTPVLDVYLDTLTVELEQQGVKAPVSIMGSNGGVMTLTKAAEFAAGTFLSGPVGGVGGAVRVCELAGVRDCITFDMGGTSTDVALIHDLAPRISHDNQIDAYPLQAAQLDIHTIGAGGGSIAWIQEDDTLEIGPRSAGALPGPACYQRGGIEPTISDANLLLGRLPTGRSLSGGLMLSRDLAEQAYHELQINNGEIQDLADGVIRIAVAKMAGAVREVSVHRGFDPRDFVLLGFGGAGPMHVFLVAEELAIPRVIIPRFPGHLSALGQLLADLRRDFVLAWGGRLSELDINAFRTRANEMENEAKDLLLTDGFDTERQSHSYSVDMRYLGQSYTLPVECDPRAISWVDLREKFEESHTRSFGHANAINDVEIVNIRLVSFGLVDKPALSFIPEERGDALIERRPVWFDGDWMDCPIYQLTAMTSGFTLVGPAIVEEEGGTSVVPPLWSVSVHSSGVLDCRLPETL